MKLLILDKGKPHAIVDHAQDMPVKTIETIIYIHERLGHDYVYVPDDFPITQEERGIDR